MRLVVVTGMSGGGKATAMKMLEDAGYYCVDNLPVPLVPTFGALLVSPGNEIQKAAVGLDIRSDKTFGDIQKALKDLEEQNISFEILFMDASDETLIRRYKETRRKHPIEVEGGILEDSIRKERQILEGLRGRADYIFDTSSLLTRDLKSELDRIFVSSEDYNSLMISIISFGFKYGLPPDADLVFDVRFLPNPYYIEELKHKTGMDREVADYVWSFPETEQFLDKLTDMVSFLIPNYVKEGKYRLVIAIGCTGGKHRSVTIANGLYNRLKDHGSYGLSLVHKNITTQS
ncbi:MAG: RNase adapter RapZ [Lachnospiraceae bacterium]|nr:RNase adapter RapZ [Lachnospiraceae bacterium]